jgi:dipeptidyl aminopeptidase/acylaminoacyl peptidase
MDLLYLLSDGTATRRMMLRAVDCFEGADAKQLRVALTHRVDSSNRFLSWLIGGGLVLALGAPGCSHQRPATAPALEEMTNVLEEIMSVGEFSRSPEPNQAVTKLAYIRAGERGNALWELDLAQGTTRLLPRKEQARRLFDWSPDDRFLLVRDFDSDEALTLYDSTDGSFKPAMAIGNAKDKQVTWLATAGQVAWLTATSFVYAGNAEGVAELRLATLGGAEKRLTQVTPPRARDLLARMSSHKVAYVSNGELWSLDVATLSATQLTTNLCKDYLWLHYSEENGAFLYCSEDNSDWRHLFRLDLQPGGLPKVTQLTFGPEHTYNGQWVQGGKGFAYVGSLTNHFYLAVRPQGPNANTNLFLGGFLYGYRVAADGNRIFAVASLGPEPCGTWEYDIAANRLRCLVPGTDRPFVASRVIPATEIWETSFDGLRIPCYRREPRNFRPGIRYPLVIAVPHRDGMFDWSWEKYSQFLANIGVIHLAVNVRGSDGYGRTFRENHPRDADRDVLAVRAAALNSGQVDAQRIFLMAHSSGGEIVRQLATEHPELWAGVILINPSLTVPKDKPRSLPPQLVFTGESDTQDDRATRAHEYEAWARTNGFPLTMLYDQSTYHFIRDVDVDKRLGLALAEFIYRRSYTGGAKGESAKR